MKQALIYMHDKQAGILTEDEDGYRFCWLCLKIISLEQESL